MLGSLGSLPGGFHTSVGPPLVRLWEKLRVLPACPLKALLPTKCPFLKCARLASLGAAESMVTATMAPPSVRAVPMYLAPDISNLLVAGAAPPPLASATAR